MSTTTSTEQLNQDNLKRTISTPAAVGVAFNQIVGGGIVSLTGVAIALTGGGVSIAFVLAVVSILIVSMPYAAIGSAMPATGGVYTYSTRLIHPIAGYAALVVNFLAQASLGLYGVAAGQYMHSLNEWFDPTLTAVVLIVAFYFANLMGAVIGARVGLVMSALMLLGFGLFIVLGLGGVDWVAYPPMLPNGFSNLIQAAALLTFATGGATVVVELGGEMKNPGRAVPISLIGGTVLAGIMYVFIAIVAAGILPIEQVANQPLSLVAAEFLPPAAWAFFILGGAMMAVISTMNSQLLTGSKSLLAAIDDGWFPKRLGHVNKKFGTPHYLLTILLVVGLAPVVANVPLDVLASAVSGIAQLIFVFVLIASLRLRSVRPDLHKAAIFKLPAGVHWGLALVGIGVCCYQSWLLISSGVSTQMLIVLGCVAVVATVWGVIRYPHVRRVLRARDEAQRAASGLHDLPSSRLSAHDVERESIIDFEP
ncbi:amino acid/polyamine/organocation transporter, APC superfamily [Paramicrobacterium humi]|uniref:Amino acid/polyamine/organocation transporter, APC superfamily n=1 Tax=Paramicrobacterium humi TaxID=640635 RepID=A0A1H4IWA6_9MICO|nr:APC family permease [Microbacterium humi]SEB38257.1 amino acid/polyamine/organocation transporter, APC superfamily [Microbacterium humi]